MTEKDILFQEVYPQTRADSNRFCHYGWEGTGAFSFWKYAQAYYESADVLFQKFTESKGHYGLLDGLGVTMCFLYRHFVELSIKYLNIKYVCESDKDYQDLLENGHHLKELWIETKSRLKELKTRVGSSVNLGALEHYIFEFDAFDRDSMTMRYPVKKDMAPTNKPTRLDIYNLHDRMDELYKAFDTLDYDLDHQLKADVEQEEIELFLAEYGKMRERIHWFIDAMDYYAQLKNSEEKVESILDSIKNGFQNDEARLFAECSDDELIMFDALYYLGRAIACEEVRLPREPRAARTDAVKYCVLNMAHDHLEFGKPKNEQIGIYGKLPSSIVEFITRSVKVIDWELQS